MANPSFTSLRAALAVLSLGLSVGACTDERPPLSGTTSFRVVLTSPTDPGTQDARLSDDLRSASIEVTALDVDGAVDTSFNKEVQVYRYFLGTLSPVWHGPITPDRMTITNGQGSGTFSLPLTYGATYLWVEDGLGADATWATGTSATMWYREPFLEDTQRPIDEASLNALDHGPLEGKYVKIASSRFGDAGKLVVTGTYAQGYTVSDVDCSTLPCTPTPYGHMYVYTFSAPRASKGDDPRVAIQIGDIVDWVSGGVNEFNGLTEFSFPATALTLDNDEALVPEPVVIDETWFASQAGMLNMEKNEGGLVAVEGAMMCALDEDFDTYSQWKLTFGDDPNTCPKPVINVISKEGAYNFDPGAYTGQTMTRVVGTLRPVNIGTFNVWIMFPRRESDLQP